MGGGKSGTKAEAVAAFGPSTGTTSGGEEGGDSFAIEEQKMQPGRRVAATKRRYTIVAGGGRVGKRTEEQGKLRRKVAESWTHHAAGPTGSPETREERAQPALRLRRVVQRIAGTAWWGLMAERGRGKAVGGRRVCPPLSSACRIGETRGQIGTHTRTHAGHVASTAKPGASPSSFMYSSKPLLSTKRHLPSSCWMEAMIDAGGVRETTKKESWARRAAGWRG